MRDWRNSESFFRAPYEREISVCRKYSACAQSNEFCGLIGLHSHRSR